MEGNLLSRLDAKGQLTRYWYDNLGQQRGVDYPDGASQQASLNDFLTTALGPNDVRLRYDDLGRVVQREDVGGVTELQYDGVSGRITLEDTTNATHLSLVKKCSGPLMPMASSINSLSGTVK